MAAGGVALFWVLAAFGSLQYGVESKTLPRTGRNAALLVGSALVAAIAAFVADRRRADRVVQGFRVGQAAPHR